MPVGSAGLWREFDSQLSALDQSITRLTGTWGDLSIQSFYPPHHLTMGEGGARISAEN